MPIRMRTALSAGLLACAATSPALAQNFYCKAESMVDADRLRDPTFQVKRPPPGARGHAVWGAYEYYLHDGQMGISSASDTYTFPGVALRGRSGGALIYADRKGNRWTVTPLGGNRLRIAGPRVDGGAVVAVACNGPDAAASAPAHVRGMTTAAAGQSFRFACKDGFRFEVVAAVRNGVWPAAITLNVPGQPPQHLTLDPADADRATWKNAGWEFYSFKRFTTLTEQGGRRRFHDCP